MSKKSAANGDPSIICRAVENKNGDRYFLIGTETKSEWISMNEMFNDEKQAMATIGRTGIPAMTTKAKNAIKEAIEKQTKFDPALVATRPGWIRDDIYVHANGEVQPPSGVGVEVIVAFQPDLGWSKRGTLKEWKKGLNRLIPGNRLAAGLLCYAFASLILSKVPSRVINPALQLVGPPESGKSTLATMVMSIFGGDPSSEIGIGRTWDMSPKAQEELRRMSNDAVLFLDEENVQDEKVRGNHLPIFLHSSSGGRARPGESERKNPLRSALLSTANVSSSQLKGRGQSSVDKAAATRLISLVFNGPLLDKAPPGFNSTRDVARALSQHSASYYGSASRAFVKEIINACVADKVAFGEQIAKHMRRFDKKAPRAEHGSERIRTTFALMYAAGRLAEQWKIMPSDCASARKSVVALCRRAEAAGEPFERNHALKMIREFVAKHDDELMQIVRSARGQRAVSPGRLGCIVRDDEAVTYYLRPKRFKSLLGNDAIQLLKQLQLAGLLQAESQRHTVKSPEVIGIKERVHKIVLPL